MIKGDLRVLYYSTAYYADHGGRIQSVLFYQELAKNPHVSKALLYPPKGTLNKSEKRIKGFRGGLRKLLRKNPLLQVLFFYRRSQFYLEGLFRLIENEKPDVVIMQLDSSFYQIKYIKKAYPNLIIATQVNASPFDEPFKNIFFKRYFRFLERKCLSLADVNFFISENLRNRIMRKQMRLTRDVVYHNGVETDKFKPLRNKYIRSQLNLPSESFIIGYVGTLDSHKKVHWLIQSFIHLAVQNSKLLLVIIGSGPEYERLSKLVSDNEMDKQVVFTGWVNHEDIPDYLNAMDVAVHHCANDYMSPLKLFEYLAVRLPVIGPDVPAVREVFEDETHLLLVDKNSIEDLKSQMGRMIRDNELRERLSNAGYQHIVENYTWEKYAKCIAEDIYKVKQEKYEESEVSKHEA